MDLKQLTSFIAVAEEGQLSRAAARLCLSQPPLSRHIHALEAELGARLFDRTATGMTLTQAGVALLDNARSIENLLHQARDKVRKAGLGQSGQMDVGLYGSAIYGAVPRILRQFKISHPDVALNLHYAQTPEQVKALRRKQVLIVFERMLPSEPDIEVLPVCRERLYVAISEEHPLAQSEWLDIGELRDETFIPGTEVTAASQLVEICRKAGFVPRMTPPSNNMVTATLLAAVGVGVSLVPESMTHVQLPGVVYRPLNVSESYSMDLHCFYLQNNSSPLLASMLEVVRGVSAPPRG
ncbi:LysR family transcriptional regulator [Candidimonas sp. SYP-B2681]|uniref:LysR substrate-binding domain-containing protein n=1 Tax=Candidimonas sp. SYP-B2681 TaxID=2497686 RepID=UPI000F890298|nr:LysR substrate-binding domain-containing protein [Candidimonas sp. SYP-B2681]RTZ45393.1 LysR family transcriptional regulator [Candidimonas sp. SYP-B2681]